MAKMISNSLMTKVEPEEKPPQDDRLSENRTSADIWQEFVDGTTLHGIRYVFVKRHIIVRLLWLAVLLTASGYFVFTVSRAFGKYYSRPVNTVLSTKRLEEMDFPAVTICSKSRFSKSKIFMSDDDPLFASSGINISSCAVTSGVRDDRPCGWSLLCCCTPYSPEVGPNCTRKYRQDLLAVMQNGTDLEELYQTYSQDINALVSPWCIFGSGPEDCSANDFIPTIHGNGMCYTFNSRTDEGAKKVCNPGVSNGLSVILDAQTHDYYLGRYSQGFTVLVHRQGEYVNEWEGTNVGPGQHAFIALSQKRFKNLEKPYITECSKKTLKTFSTYTVEGCFYECDAENIVKICKCRKVGYQGHLDVPVCTPRESDCFVHIEGPKYKFTYDSPDFEDCDCPFPCDETVYHTEVSYSKFPDTDFAKNLISDGHYPDEQYQRDNFVLLEVGFKSLSYDLQEQQPAFDSNSLFGEIGGNMGLFLGCSLLTIFEFLDILFSIVAARMRRNTRPA